MSKKVRFSVDVMGTDKGPQTVIEGLFFAHKLHPTIEFHLYGPEDIIEKLLPEDSSFKSACVVHHAPEEITNEEKVSQAIRRKNTSMKHAIEAVANKEVDAVISGGNTGAYMALATILLKTIPGISRPAIATTFPTISDKCVMLDMGANIDCTPSQLVEFSIMGNIFAKDLLNIDSPTVGLLNIGHEELKGKPELHTAHAQLKKITTVLNYIGFIEGNDIPAGKADVVVTDGFTGNVAIKTAEGIGTMIASVFKQSIQSNLFYKIYKKISSKSHSSLSDHFDPVKYNGAMFLGLNGLAIKSHGSASSRGIANAIEVAYKLNQYEFNAQIERDLVACRSHLA